MENIDGKKMIDISDKIKTLRTAKAQAIVKMSKDSIEKIKNKQVPKGDVLEISKSVAMLSAKKLSDILPFCHNIPITWTGVKFTFNEDNLKIEVTVKTIYQTGCEMEALYAASCSALNVYDMLKPIDDNIEIVEIKLVEKSGGKSDFKEEIPPDFKAGVLVISDSVYSGKKSDKSGLFICDELKKIGIQNIDYKIVPDEKDLIRQTVLNWCESGYNLILTTGGTGLSPRDVTPEAIKPLIEREIPAIMENARFYGFERTPYSMLSRGIAGVRGETLIITLPGSSRGVKESMNALFPYVLHVFKVMKMTKHD